MQRKLFYEQRKEDKFIKKSSDKTRRFGKYAYIQDVSKILKTLCNFEPIGDK